VWEIASLEFYQNIEKGSKVQLLESVKLQGRTQGGCRCTPRGKFKKKNKNLFFYIGAKIGARKH